MFHAEADEFRRVGNGPVACGGIAHRKDAHFSRHPIEIPDPLLNRMVGQCAPESCGDRNPRRRLIGERRRIGIEQDLVDRW